MKPYAWALAWAVVLPVWAEQMTPLSPAESLARFQIEPGLRIELVAAEPLVKDPVALAFDPEGRMYVVENTGYPTRSETDPPLGVIALLEDQDRDGVYDTRSVFADGFDFPNGIMCWRGGVLVTNAPAVYFLKDTDGDGVADVREEVLSGFALGGSTQLRVSHPTLGIDNWIYMTNGLSGGDVRVAGAADATAVALGSMDLRYHPLTKALEPVAGQAQFGLTFNDRGHRFICSNRKHIEQAVIHPDDLARNPHAALVQTTADIPDHGGAAPIFAISDATTTAFAHAGTFTAACGLVVYRGTALTDAHYGNSFTCEPTGNLVHRDILEPSGGSYVARRSAEGVEFLASDDNWSRPVFLANGPDGALYMCDMYRKTIEHPAYLPAEVVEVTDFDAGKGLGRIYRIVAGDAPPTAAEAAKTFAERGLDDLVALLDHPNAWHRDTAHRLLLESGGAMENLKEAASGGSAQTRAHSLHLLDAAGALDDALLEAALGADDALVAEQAIRIARGRLGASPALIPAVAGLASHPDSQVRFAAALALGDLDGADRVAPLYAVLMAAADDEWTRSAVLSGVSGVASAFGAALLEGGVPDGNGGFDDFMEPFGRTLVMETAVADMSPILTGLLAKREGGSFASWQIELVRGMADGARRAPSLAGEGAPLTRLAALAEPGAVDGLIAQAAASASDASAPAADRVGAVALLGYGSPEAVLPKLEPLLSPATAEEVQVAAVQSLALLDDPAVGPILASPERWPGYTAPVRAAAMTALHSTPDRVLALLRAIESGAVAPWTVSPGDRSRLQNHRDEAVKALARAVFADVKKEDRSAVFAELKPVLGLAPNAANGREVFVRVCATCHLYSGEGHAVGPDLSGLRSQPIESILLHIIDPNWLMEPGYENYVIETADFETATGLIVNQNESTITVRGTMAVEKTIPRSEIVSMTTANLSLMPDELEKSMTEQELRDLLAFLKHEN